MKYLALGDSYTIGEGVQPDKRWPTILASALDLSIDDEHIIATTGWTTGELINALSTIKPEPVYDVCSLLIGVNNQYRGLTIEEYANEFEALLSSAIHFTQERPQHTLVVSIPDWGVSPFANGQDREAIATQIDEFNKVNKSIADEKGVHYADITHLSRTLTQEEYFAEDGLHPSGIAYELWVEEIVLSLSVSLFEE